jgi:hypothetical protein
VGYEQGAVMFRFGGACFLLKVFLLEDDVLAMTAGASIGARTEFGSSPWIDRWLTGCHDLAEVGRCAHNAA